MSEPGKDIVQWADAAMYEAQPIKVEEGVRVTPRVFLLSATPDPLGALAAGMRMYKGNPVYTIEEISDDERKWAWEEVMRSHLDTPLEFIDLQFMVEAVSRAWTHQVVRQRVGSVFAQESLRFAVKRGFASEVAIPPSIVNLEEGPGKIWSDTIQKIDDAYQQLVDAGIPAEDARGLLPHAVTTRMIWKTNLRALFRAAGDRLCTQAQFEWRAVMLGIMKAIAQHDEGRAYPARIVGETHDQLYAETGEYAVEWRDSDWQWELIASPRGNSFAPVCYKLNRCPFKSELDRGCSIRGRVDLNAELGRPSEVWGSSYVMHDDVIPAINPAEWAANPWAGITTEDNRPT